jgi:hypothetical protein
LNISPLKNIKTRGEFPTSASIVCGPLSLCTILPINTPSIGRAYTNLRKITLDKVECDQGQSREGSQSPHRDNKKLAAEEINNTILKLIEGIPGLRQLQLGDYEIPFTDDGRPAYDASDQKPEVDEWDSFRRWETIVEERAGASLLREPRDEPVNEGNVIILKVSEIEDDKLES